MNDLIVSNERSSANLSYEYDGVKVAGTVHYNKDGLISINGSLGEGESDIYPVSFDISKDYRISITNAYYKDAPQQITAVELFVNDVLKYIEKENKQ